MDSGVASFVLPDRGLIDYTIGLLLWNVCVGGRQYQADIEMHAQMDMYVSACLYQMVYVHIVLYSRTRE